MKIINFKKIKNHLLDIFFPKFCLGCGKEGTFFCQDCQSCLEILENSFCLCENPKRLPEPGKCDNCRTKKLDGLYFAVSYQNRLVKKMIQEFKHEPFIKDLAEPIANLVVNHILLLKEENRSKKGDVLIPIPLSRKKLKSRGFNQSEEIAKKLSKELEIPVIADCLIKIKETPAQTELSREERRENIKGAFEIKEKEKVQDKKILLVDDFYTTGATMEEAARILKEAGAKEVWGITLAREG